MTEKLNCEATLGCTNICTERALASNRCFLQSSVELQSEAGNAAFLRAGHSRAPLSRRTAPIAGQHGGVRACFSLRTPGSDVTRQLDGVERAGPRAEVTQYWCDWAGARRRLLCGGARWRFPEPPLLLPSRTVRVARGWWVWGVRVLLLSLAADRLGGVGAAQSGCGLRWGTPRPAGGREWLLRLAAGGTAALVRGRGARISSSSSLPLISTCQS